MYGVRNSIDRTWFLCELSSRPYLTWVCCGDGDGDGCHHPALIKIVQSCPEWDTFWNCHSRKLYVGGEYIYINIRVYILEYILFFLPVMVMVNLCLVAWQSSRDGLMVISDMWNHSWGLIGNLCPTYIWWSRWNFFRLEIVLFRR